MRCREIGVQMFALRVGVPGVRIAVGIMALAIVIAASAPALAQSELPVVTTLSPIVDSPRASSWGHRRHPAMTASGVALASFGGTILALSAVAIVLEIDADNRCAAT